MKLSKHPLLLLMFLLGISVKAQQVSPYVVNSSGQTFTNGTAQLSSNIGELAITSIGNGTNSITQGFLQPKSNQVSIKENTSKIVFSVFPNPTSNELSISSDYKEIIHVKIIDCMGRELLAQEISNNKISLGEISPGVYQILILDKSKKVLNTKTITKL